jgi:hypothetical protein
VPTIGAEVSLFLSLVYRRGSLDMAYRYGNLQLVKRNKNEGVDSQRGYWREIKRGHTLGR